MMEDNYKRDIEETEIVLDGDIFDPIAIWESKTRELVTSVVDYNLGTLADLVFTESIDLSPEYQRRFRWDDTRQSKLIESFLMNVPIPPFFLNEDEFGTYSVIDGKQRLNAITRFLGGQLVLKDLEVFHDLNGLSFDSLPRRFQTVIKTRPTLRGIIVLHQSDPDVKFEVFQRLNTGGVRLNAQEIRNSTYTGALNDLVLDLSVNTQFHRLLRIKNKEISSVYREMRDAEFVLRFLTFRDSWETFPGGFKRSLDVYMSQNRHMNKKQIKDAKSDFLNTLEVVEACFSDHAFQRWVPGRNQWRQPVVASLFDAQMLACRSIAVSRVRPKQDEIIEQLKLLFSDDDFRKSIDAATNAPNAFRYRIERMRDLITGILR